MVIVLVLLTALIIGCGSEKIPTGSVVADVVEEDSMEHDTMEMEDNSADDNMIEGEDLENDDSMKESPTHTFALTGENFKFMMDGQEAPELRVKKGDIVRIEFSSASGFHDWVVDEFDAATKKVKAGDSTSVQFAADKEGVFEYYCSIGSHRENGMVGKLVVE